MGKNSRDASELQATTKVRVLQDCAFGLVGQIAEIPTELVAGARAAAQVDDDPAAIAYVERLIEDEQAKRAAAV